MILVGFIKEFSRLVTVNVDCTPSTPHIGISRQCCGHVI
jgi:hypothetical protein